MTEHRCLNETWLWQLECENWEMCELDLTMKCELIKFKAKCQNNEDAQTIKWCWLMKLFKGKRLFKIGLEKRQKQWRCQTIKWCWLRDLFKEKGIIRDCFSHVSSFQFEKLHFSHKISKINMMMTNVERWIWMMMNRDGSRSVPIRDPADHYPRYLGNRSIRSHLFLNPIKAVGFRSER